MYRSVKLVSLVLFVAACSAKPEAIRYGKDACDFCRMTIMDPKFGGELITKKGKVYKFDSEECLVDYYKTHVVRPGDFTVILVADYSAPGKMLQAEQTVFLQDDHISSPMGAHLAAFPTKETARKYQASAHGRIIDWNDLLMLEQ